jgi:hypothetical protein
MPAKKREPAPPWQAILEEIRSQNRATIEAGETNRIVLEQRIEQLDRATAARLEVLEAAVKELRQESRTGDESLEASLKEFREESRSRDESLAASVKELRQESRSGDQSLEVAIRDLKVSVQQNSVDLRDLAGKVEALARLEERVAALERRSA